MKDTLTDFWTSYRNVLALLVMTLSIVLLIPGLVQPILTLKAELVFFGMKKSLLNETRSIWQTVQQFKGDGHLFVAGLIFLFSILVPFLKIFLFFIGLCLKKTPYFILIHGFIMTISKWAMADVFLVGLWILYLSANTMDAVSASLGPGFFFFTGYCVFSILGFQLYCPHSSKSYS